MNTRHLATTHDAARTALRSSIKAAFPDKAERALRPFRGILLVQAKRCSTRALARELAALKPESRVSIADLDKVLHYWRTGKRSLQPPVVSGETAKPHESTNAADRANGQVDAAAGAQQQMGQELP